MTNYIPSVIVEPVSVWRVFLENINSRYIKREKPMFKKRHELCYTNWVYETNGGDR